MVVLVRGRFDLFHSGHVAFLKRASESGDKLLVLVVSDSSCQVPAEERRFIVENIKFVWKCRMSSDTLKDDLELFRPQVFYFNADDPDAHLKMSICTELGIRVETGKRIPLENIPPRSSTTIKSCLVHAHPPAPESNEPILDLNKLPRPLVFVSGCYDFLHSGHVAFFNDAVKQGEALYVSIGNDENIEMLKHHQSMFPQHERKLLVSSMKSVFAAGICTASGMLDFESDLDSIKPDIFFVNEDGDRESKRDACERRGIKYVVGTRLPSDGLQVRSSTDLKLQLNKDSSVYGFPWRICLAGGWLDQPWVSEIYPGAVIVLNIKPQQEFKVRSGLATSSRQVGMDLWGCQKKYPDHLSREQLAKYLFGAENPPGTKYISGSQDHLGLMLPGINLLTYDGGFWPTCIQSIRHQATISWLEKVLWLVPLSSRPDGYDPLLEKNVNEHTVKALAEASMSAWNAILKHDAKLLGGALTCTLEAWKNMLPLTVPSPEMNTWCAPYRDTCHGYLLSGCGGGFLLVVSDEPIDNGFQIQINNID